MKLLTQEIEKSLPALYSTESTPTHEKIAYLKIFDPTGRLTYYATEYDPSERLFFGYMVSPLGPDCDEWGNSNLTEFEGVRGRFGLGLERDIHFEPTKIGKLFPEMIPDELRDSFDPKGPEQPAAPSPVFTRGTIGDVLAAKHAGLTDDEG